MPDFATDLQQHRARMSARTTLQDAALAYLLRQAIADTGSRSKVRTGVGMSAFFQARSRGKEVAVHAKSVAMDEFDKLVGETHS